MPLDSWGNCKSHWASEMPTRRILFVEFCSWRMHNKTDLRPKAISEIYDNSCLKSIAYNFYALCGKNENGAYCNVTSFELGRYISNVHNRCSLNTNCTISCHEALIEPKEELSCCTNSYLYYNFNFHMNTCQNRKDIWSHCNVESPGFCSKHSQLHGSDDPQSGDTVTDPQSGGNVSDPHHGAMILIPNQGAMLLILNQEAVISGWDMCRVCYYYHYSLLLLNCELELYT